MQKLSKIIILVVLLFSSLNIFAQDTTPVIESEYISGTVIKTNTNEAGFTEYVTKTKHDGVITIDTYGEKVPVGSKIYIEKYTDTESGVFYNYIAINRTPIIVALLGFFIVLILVLIPKKGWRSLVSLGLSLLILLLGLVPLLLKGYSPTLVTLGFGFLVLSLSIFITHGINKQSLVSFIGSLVSIVVSIIILELIIKTGSLTGLINDEIQLLSLDSEVPLRLVRIVNASIIIGILGVLDDITITQVAVVRELSSSVTNKVSIFKKALRVGQDHISSLVNTLVFAYVGATLPMIMFVSLLEVPLLVLISQEYIFIEIVRSFVGAIALALAVPVTTWIAVYVFLEAIKGDKESIESACAHHGHSH